jgi:enamine deaminase RidA (YjgF/YER057c/UK114 family)
LLYISGNTHGPIGPKGKLGREVSIEQGYESSRQIALRELSILRSYLGSLDRVKKVVKVLGMVNSVDGFGDQPKVIDGFSDTMVSVFGEKIGKHARSTIGVAGVPGNNPVLIEMILEIE